MPNPTLYERLGLPRDATQEEIKHAYRQLVLRLHPDRNTKKGETELFIDIQQAYELLTNPLKKADYDQKLPYETLVDAPLLINTIYSQTSLFPLSEPQLLYALLELNLHPSPGLLASTIPLNISLVVDCSTSMQGIRLDTVKLTAIELMRQLKPADMISLIKFNDWAELLISPGNITDLKSDEMKIQLLQAGGGTEIFKGLEMGFSQVSQNLSRQRVNHIILITDGRTYGDESNCEKLADQCSALGIGISAIGIGNQWNDKFLDRITSKTGGICKYIAESRDIRSTLLNEISRLGSSLTDQINLIFTPSLHVELRSAFRLQPDASPLEPVSPVIFGSMPRYGSMNILMEFLIKDLPSELSMFTLVRGFLNYEIPRLPEKTKYVQRLILERKITLEPERSAPPNGILSAVSLISLFRMQERASLEMTKGNFRSAARQMEHMATHLLDHGETLFANSIMDEVAFINQNQSFSADGEKRIKYGTRALLLPARTKGNRE